MRRAISSLIFVVVVGLVTAVPAAGQCRVTDPKSLGTYTGGEARGIDQKGEVVGYVWNPYGDPYAGSDVFRGFLWKKGTIGDIGSLAEVGPTNPDNAVVAQGINDHGQIVGFANAADATQTAFIWETGSLGELVSIPPDPPTAAYSHAWAINNSSQVAGTNRPVNRVGRAA